MATGESWNVRRNRSAAFARAASACVAFVEREREAEHREGGDRDEDLQEDRRVAARRASCRTGPARRAAAQSAGGDHHEDRPRDAAGAEAERRPDEERGRGEHERITPPAEREDADRDDGRGEGQGFDGAAMAPSR